MKQVLYFSGNTFNQVIKEAIEVAEQEIFPPVISNELDFLKTIRQNYVKYDTVDTLILDESICHGVFIILMKY